MDEYPASVVRAPSGCLLDGASEGAADDRSACSPSQITVNIQGVHKKPLIPL